ncbi:hypothetical protein L9F63_022909, partial [Diploptera punctata]
VQCVCCAVSGLMADSRTMIDRARVECQNHWFIYNEKTQTELVNCKAMSLFTVSEFIGSTLRCRPFGVAILFAGCDEKGPQLFHMDPSGTFVQFEAKAIGSGSEGAQQSLQEVYHKDITSCAAIFGWVYKLYQVMEEKLSSTNVEVMTMTPERKFHMFT